MPRQPRYFLPGIPQHVVQRGVDKRPTFFEPKDYELFLRALGDSARTHECLIHAYVLMTNHTHLLVTPGHAKSLPLLMQSMGRNYVQKINRKYGRTGPLWEGRYKASLVQDDRYLLACHRYIELNPVRAGLVSAPSEYPYSSYSHNALGKPGGIVEYHPVYRSLASKVEDRLLAYRSLFNDDFPSELLTTIRTATNACRILGNDRFKDQIEAMIGKSVRPKKNGRPKKTEIGLVPKTAVRP